jgi:hypothetical protein
MCGAAVAAGLCVPAVAAQASSGLITVTSASSPASSVGDLSIGLEATSTVNPTSITAILYAAGAATPALTVTGFTQTGGPGTGAGATTWTVASPIPSGSGPGALPLGSYRIEVKAADQGGDTTDDADAGTLAYLIQPTVRLTVSPAAYSYGQQVTISGTDTGLYPDGSQQPVEGQQVELDNQPYASATTAPDGSFSFSAKAGFGQLGALLGAGSVQAWVAPDATTAPGYSDYVPITVERDQARMTGTRTPNVVKSGGMVTFAGTVSYENGSAWQPLTGTTVNLQISFAPLGADTWDATTGQSGQYTFTVRADLPEHYTVDVGSNGLDTTWFYATAASFTVVPVDVQVSDRLGARMTGSGRVQLTSCVAMSNPRSEPVYLHAAAPLPTMRIQYARSKTGAWRTLATATRRGGGCRVVTVRVPGRSDYYRTVTSADTAYKAGASAAVRATPAAKSAITAFTAGPRKLAAGDRVKVTGRLTGTGTKPGQTVELYFRPSGSRRWRAIGRVKLTARSTFAGSARLYHSGDIEVRYGGAAFTRPCRSRIVYIRVTR